MPAAMTYASLQESIRNYLERGYSAASDPTVYANIPFFIGLAERRLARELKVLGTINVASSTMTVGEGRIAKPDRWRQVVSMHIGTGDENNTMVEVKPRAYEVARAYWPDATATAQPKYWADYDYDHWLVVPTPDEAYPYEVLYNEMPALLSDDTQENWFTQYCPDALLYGALMEAQPFLKNPEMTQTWQGLYDRSLAAINGQDQGGMTDRTIVRSQN